MLFDIWRCFLRIFRQETTFEITSKLASTQKNNDTSTAEKLQKRIPTLFIMEYTYVMNFRRVLEQRPDDNRPQSTIDQKGGILL